MNTCEKRYQCTECAGGRYVEVPASRREDWIEVNCPECDEVTTHRPKGGVRWFG